MGVEVDLGETFTNRDQVYRVVGYRQHVKRDGSVCVLTELSSHCRTCGAEFQTATIDTGGYLSLRCAEHKTPVPWARKTNR